MRTLVMPIPAATRTTLAISSMVSMSECRLSSMPSAGMQYTHLKLHRSVTDTRM